MTPKTLTKPLSFAQSASKLNSASSNNLPVTPSSTTNPNNNSFQSITIDRTANTAASQRTLTLNKDSSLGKIQPMNTLMFKTTNSVLSSSINNFSSKFINPEENSASKTMSKLNSHSSSVNYISNKSYSISENPGDISSLTQDNQGHS